MKKNILLITAAWFCLFGMQAQYTGGIGSGYDMASTGQLYQLSFVLEGEGDVTVEVDGVVVDPESPGSNNYFIEDGTEVTINASPASGWVFGYWAGDAVPPGEEEETVISFTLEEATVITARFLKILTIAGDFTVADRPYDGTVVAVIQEDNLELDGKIAGDDVVLTDVVVEFDHAGPGENIEVSITGAAIDGVDVGKYSFDYVTGAPTTTASIYFVLTIAIDGEGSVDIEGTGYVAASQEVRIYEDRAYDIEAVASGGWEFSHWDGDVADIEEPVTTITIDEDKSLAVYFTQSEYNLNIYVDGEGSVDIDPDEVVYYYNDEVTLTATPEEGWMFDGWSGDLIGSLSPANILMDSDKDITATFVEKAVLTINIQGEGSVAVKKGAAAISPQDDGTYDVEIGSELTLEAVAEDDWAFTNWEGPDADGLGSTSAETTTITMDGDKEVAAVFDLVNIVELIEKGDIKLYPNPARNNINLEIENIKNLVSVEIINSYGQVIVDKRYDKTRGSVNETFDLTNFDSGMYYVRIVTQSGSISRGFVVKR